MIEDNSLFKTVKVELDVSAQTGKKIDEVETKATFFSFDKGTGKVEIFLKKDGQALGLPEGSEAYLSVLKSDDDKMQYYTPTIVDRVNGKLEWVLPEQLLGFRGRVRAGVGVGFSNSQTVHAGYFRFNMEISDMDKDVGEFEDFFWQSWDEFQNKALAKFDEFFALTQAEVDQKITEYNQKFDGLEAEASTLKDALEQLQADGKLYEAWSNSPDGSSEIHAKRPLPNLLNSSNSFKGKGWSTYGGAVATVTENQTVTEWGAIDASRIQLTGGATTVKYLKVIEILSVGETRAYAMYVKNNGTTSVRIVGNVLPNNVGFLAPGFSGLIYVWGAATTVGGAQIQITVPNASDNVDITVWRVKLIHGTKEDMDYWVPSATDDPLGAIMQYHGVSLLPSDRPQDYIWQKSDEYLDYLREKDTNELKEAIRALGGSV